MSDLHELKKQIDWLQDELSAASNVDGSLDNIDAELTEIKDDLNRCVMAIDRNTDKLNEVVGAINQFAEAVKKLLVEVLTPKPPPPPSDTLGEFFGKAGANKPKARAGKTKPRKTKPRKTRLSVVSKDGDGGPRGAR